MSDEVTNKEVPVRIEILAKAFGRKPYEEFKFKGCKKIFRITERGLESHSSVFGRFSMENFLPWMFYAETE